MCCCGADHALRRAAAAKTVLLVRHAESTNNVAKRTLKRTLALERWPVAHEWRQLASLLTFPMDTPLSAAGEAMLREQRAALDAAPQLTRRLELVLHSPLQRARDTAVALFGGSEGGPPLEEAAAIYEKSLAEHAGLRSLRQRTRAFTAALRARPEQRIAVVGHSAFFRDLEFGGGDGVPGEPACGFDKAQLLNLSTWRASLTADDGGGGAPWQGLELVLPGWPRQTPEAGPEGAEEAVSERDVQVACPMAIDS